jgi:hypothetical protein
MLQRCIWFYPELTGLVAYVVYLKFKVAVSCRRAGTFFI